MNTQSPEKLRKEIINLLLELSRIIVLLMYLVTVIAGAIVALWMLVTALARGEKLNAIYLGFGLLGLGALAFQKELRKLEDWLMCIAFEPDNNFLRWHPTPASNAIADTSSEDFQKLLAARAKEIADKRGTWLHQEDDLKLADAQLRGIDAGEAREIEKAIRAMVEHENLLMNNRIQWFLTINGFLITAIFLSSRLAEKSILITLMALVGLAISLSFWLSLSTGRKAVGRLLSLWKDYRLRAIPTFNETGVIGSRLLDGWNYLAPWWALPPVLAVFWLIVMLHSTLAPELLRVPTPGTHVFIEKAKLEGINTTILRCPTNVFRFNTASGEIECGK